MERRHFLGASVIGASTLALSACQSSSSNKDEVSMTSQQKIVWKMATTWPKNFPGLGTGAEYFAKKVNAMSGGRLTIQVHGAGEIVPALQVFDAVMQGTVQIGHGAAYYWKAKNPALQFFTAVPFGLLPEEVNGWLYYGGGLKLWQELCEPFGVIPFPGGNTGVQMAGWFNKKINSLEDIKGLKMRIPGLGGEVFKRLGGIPVNLPGGELFSAMQSGTIDATEWVGPYNDLAFGLHRVAKYYYYPGWQEAGSVMEILVNRRAYEELSQDLQEIIATAAQAANIDMLSEYNARNAQALETLKETHKVEILSLPEDVLTALRETSMQVLEEIATQSADSRKVYDAYRAYESKVAAWDAISNRRLLTMRA